MYKCEQYYVAFEICRLDTNLRFQSEEPDEIIEVLSHWKEKDNPEIELVYYYAPNTIEIGNPLYNSKGLSNWSTEENPIIRIRKTIISPEQKTEEIISEIKKYFSKKTGLFSRLLIENILSEEKQ